MNKKYCSVIQISNLSISMHIQNLIKIHKLIHKLLSINKILTLIKGHNSVKKWPKIMCITTWILYISMHIQILSKFIHLFWRYWGKTQHFFTSIKGYNSVVYKPIKSICKPKPLLPDINVYATFEENRSKTTPVKSPEMKRWRMDGCSNGSEGIT